MLTLYKFMKACKESGGIITLIAKRLSVDRSTVYDFIKKEPRALKYLKDAEEAIIDIAESKLLNSIGNGQMEDVKWFLSRKARHRGYIANPEIIVNNENHAPSYTFEIISPDEIKNEQK